MQKFISTLFTIVLLTGCAHGGGNAPVVGDGLRFALRSPASFGQQLVLVQAATLSFAGERHELLFHTEITAESLAIVGSLPSGTRLFSIIWDGRRLRSEGYEAVFGRMPPANFVADLQVAQWPLAEVQAGFADSDCFSTGSCQLTETADQLLRELRDGNASVLRIRYDGLPHHAHAITYDNRSHQYQLQIDTLEVQTLVAEP